MQRLMAIVVVCLFAPVFVKAQSARVSGEVTDAQHGAITACVIVMRNTATQAEYRTVSTENGRFLLPPVPPGDYEITASAPGFATQRIPGLTLEVGDSRVITVQLQPASVHEVVQVADTPPELTTDRQDRGVVIVRAFESSFPMTLCIHLCLLQ